MRLLGIEIDALTFDEAVAAVLAAARGRQRGVVVTPNVDHIVQLSENEAFRAVYRDALFVLADGAPVVAFSRLRRHTRLPARVTGADLFPRLCAEAASTGLRVALVGGNPGVAELAAKRLCAAHPGLQITGTYSPPFGFEHDAAECSRIVGMVNAWRPDMLFLGLGAPKQELWAHQHAARLEAGPILCVGAAFDFVAGTVQRAPTWMRHAGLEWFWRLVSEPRRLAHRYLVRDVRFIPLAVRDLLLRR
ncbi:MAG: WecB/TagA/CpsF family glycosyltransferase [Pseudomonadota bacterium]